MAKVNKQSIEIKVVTLGGNEFTAKDTETAKAGSLAFQLFQRKEIVEIKGEEDTTYVPFHAIDHVVVKKTSSAEEVEDENCITEDSADDSDETVTP